MKLLVIRLSSIGDIVLTTPVLRCIKQQKPEAQVHYLVKESFKTTLSANPYIDKLHGFTELSNLLIDTLKEERYDYIIDLHNNIRTARIKNALQSKTLKSYSFPKLNVEKWLLVNIRLNLLPDKSIVERYFDAVKPLGIHNDGKGMDYFIPEAEQTNSDDIPMSHWAGYVGFVIGGSYATKKFPIAQWKRLCEEVKYPVVLLGGPEDKEEGHAISCIDPMRIYNACGKFSLNESADLVRKARLIVTNDTGLMHIAAAFQKPIISLWGNTTPEMGMFPYYGYNNLKNRIAPNSFIIENKMLSCRPCSKLGYQKCPKKHFRCMNELNVLEIRQNIEKIWLQPN